MKIISNGVGQMRSAAFAALTLGCFGLGFGTGCTSPSNPTEDAAQQGFLALKNGRVTEARTLFQDAANHGSTDADVWRALAAIDMKLREFPEAARSAQRLTELAPTSSDGWKLLGTSAFRLGNQFRAFSAFTRAAALKPDDPDIQQGLGQSGLLTGRLTEAKQALETVQHIRPNDSVTLAALAQVTLRMEPTREGLALAEAEADHALVEKETGGARVTRAQIYLAQRRYGAAIAECTRVIALYPKLAVAHSLLAKAAAASGQTALARREGTRYEALLEAAGSAPPPDEGRGRP